MKPDPQEPAGPVTLLRQQLILAQVRIMELEDARDALAPRLADLERQLAQAQALADGKIDEAAHLTGLLAETRERADQLAELHRRASADLERTAREAARLREEAATRDSQLTDLRAAHASLQDQLARLRATRSWRWTAWLRGK